MRATFGSVTASATVTVQTINLFSYTVDIGSPTLAGSSTYSNGTYTLDGAGTDIWGTSDQFRFTYKAMTGDITIVALVTGVEATDVWAKAGVMIRESTAAGARYACLAVTPSSGITFQRRTATGGSSASTVDTGFTAPYWVKVVRSGNNFSAYRSADGLSWTQVGTTQTITMASTVYVGLAVTSHTASAVCTSTFTNVSVGNVVSNTRPMIVTAANANPNPLNNATSSNLGVLGTDDGGAAVLTYNWSTSGTPPAPVTFSVNGTKCGEEFHCHIHQVRRL